MRLKNQRLIVFNRNFSFKQTCLKYRYNYSARNPVIDFCTKYKIPNRYKELALIVCEYHTHCHKAFEMNPNKIMKLFERTKAESKYERFIKFLKACESDAKGRGGDFPNRIYKQQEYLKECLDAVKCVDTKS